MKKLQQIVEKLGYTAYFLFFILVFINGAFVRGPEQFQMPSLYILFYSLLFALFIVGIDYLLEKVVFLQREIVFLPLVTFATFAPRYVWVRLIRTVPVYDFARYHNYAKAIVGGQYDAFREIRGVFPHLTGYPLVLSYVYRVFGDSPEVGKWFNIFCSLLTVIVIYYLGKEAVNARVGRISAILFALWPAQIMYTPVLASEHLFTMVFLLAFYMLFKYTNRRLENRELWRLLLLGVIMGIAHPLRPIASALFPAMAIYLLFFKEQEGSLGKDLLYKGKLFILVILGFAVTMNLLNFIYVDKVKVPLGKTGTGFNLYVGTNPERTGMWTPEDWEIVEEYDYDFDAIHKEAKRRGIERITSDYTAFIRLVEKKFAIQWSTDEYGFYWSMLERYPETNFGLWVQKNKEIVNMTAQVFYIGVVMLSLYATYHLLWKEREPKLGLFTIMVSGFVLLHAFIEVQPRYHHSLVPFFMVTAAFGAAKLLGGVNRVKEKRG